MIGTMGKFDNVAHVAFLQCLPLKIAAKRVLRFIPLRFWSLRLIQLRFWSLRFLPLRFWSLIFISNRFFFISSMIQSKVSLTHWYKVLLDGCHC